MSLGLHLGLRLGAGAVGAFSPASLFAAGEQGYWLDPSDFSTMFQDAAGTTPVTAVGQSVGFLGDKSQGFALGPELVGAFTAYANASFSTVGGVTTITCTANGSYGINLGYSGVAGKTYLVSFTVVSNSAPRGVFAWSSITSSISLSAGTTTGAKIGRLQATAGGSGVIAILGAVAGETFSVSNISVRELLGNHFTQANVANAPILGREPFGGRRNLLTFTEQFDNAAWTKTLLGSALAPTVAANAGSAPDGSTTADRVQFSLNGATASGDLSILRQAYSAQAGNHAFSIYLKSFDSNSYVMTITAGGAERFITVTPTWQRFEVSYTVPSPASVTPGIYLRGARTTTNSNTADILVWGGQYELASTATAYQRVTTAFDVTEAGVADCYYLSFDGTDDWLQSAATIDPGAVDKAQAFAGVRKLSDASTNTFFEAGPNSGTTAGTLGMFSSPNGYRFRTGGSILVDPSVSSGYPAPITNVLTGLGDISGDSAILRVNGAQAASSIADQGTGNYTTQTHFIGRRAGTSLPFNGRVYQMVMRFGANLTAGQITQTETFVNSKTGAY